jgi:PTH1 family peptidyl-tRNA hydrolase
LKIIVGLGNPGLEYARTRHNVGFDVVDALRAALGAGDAWKGRFRSLACEVVISRRADGGPVEKCLLLKPTTYMNLSGHAVAEALRFYKLEAEEDLLVIVDDIALPCGSMRLRAKGGAGGHNGLKHIEQMLGGNAYARLRVGVDAPGIIPQVDYVLGRFTPEQEAAVAPLMRSSVELVRAWCHDGVELTMNRFNAPDAPAKPAGDTGESKTKPESPTTNTNAAPVGGKEHD